MLIHYFGMELALADQHHEPVEQLCVDQHSIHLSPEEREQIPFKPFFINENFD